MPEDSSKRLARLREARAQHGGPKRKPAKAADGAEAATGGGKPGLVRWLRKMSSGEDGRIDPQKLRRVMAFVRKQAKDPEAPRHAQAKDLLGALKALPPQKRQRIQNMLKQDGGANRAGKGARAGQRRRAAAQQAQPEADSAGIDELLN
ncbi:MAG: hypothetical protein AAGG09_06635 [Pseudomonadota bacterium]